MIPSARRWVLVQVGLILLATAPTLAGVPFDLGLDRRWLLSLHVLGAVAMLGNVVVSALWIVAAGWTGEAAVRAYASRVLMLADAVFTGPGALLLALTGHQLLQPYGGLWAQPWAVGAVALFSATGALWAGRLIPLQQALIEQAEEAAAWEAISRRVAVPGALTILGLVVVVGLMVAKPG